jgi:hypothetical protein
LAAQFWLPADFRAKNIELRIVRTGGREMRSLSKASIISYLLFLWIFCAPGLQAQVSTQVLPFPAGKTVIEMTADELLQYYSSELRRLEWAQNQDPLSPLLNKTGERVQEFLRDFAGTSSKELVLMQLLGYTGNIARSESREFSYMMFYHPGDSRLFLEEYRTDKQNRPIAHDAVQGYFVTSGYLGFSLNFHPKYQQDLRFRYLGQQTSDSRAHIIAFAQKPDTKDLMIAYTDTTSGRVVKLPVQGIAWIDPGTFQIVRIKVNLQPAYNQSSLTEQITDIQFGDAHFKDVEKHLWLPREVVVITISANCIFRNYHRYSDFKLFAVNSEYKIDKPKPRE